MRSSIKSTGLHLGASLALILSGLTTALSATAATNFSEDFESYAPGSDLIGQGGWTSGMAGSVAPVDVGSYLPTQVLNGRSALGAPENVVGRAIGNLDPDAVTTLSFDAYAPTGTHNMTVYLADAPDGSITQAAGWFPSSSPGQHWVFAVGSNRFNVAGGYDMPVQVKVVIDGSSNEAYGIYDFGSGAFETPHYAVSDAWISATDSIYIYIDHRSGRRGMEIDNLTLAVPEPSTLAMSGLGLAWLGWLCGRRRGAGSAGVNQSRQSNS